MDYIVSGIRPWLDNGRRSKRSRLTMQNTSSWIWLMLCLLYTCAGAQCPDGYTSVDLNGGTDCFFVDSFAQVNFPDARFVCYNSTGSQSDITDIIQLGNQADPLTAAAIASVNSQEAVYIGLFDYNDDDVFEWIADGNPYNQDITANFKTDVSFFDCGVYATSGITNVACRGTTEGILCGLTELTDIINCPSGWTAIGSKCYQFYTGSDAATFDDARSKCMTENQDADLAILTPYDRNYVKVLRNRPDNTVSYYMGLNGTDGIFTWVDGQMFNNYTDDPFFLYDNRPDGVDYSNVTGCITINNDDNFAQWDLVDCTSSQNFICEVEPRTDSSTTVAVTSSTSGTDSSTTVAVTSSTSESITVNTVTEITGMPSNLIFIFVGVGVLLLVIVAIIMVVIFIKKEKHASQSKEPDTMMT